MGKGRGGGETLGEQQALINVLSLGGFFNPPVLIEESREGANHVLTHGFEQEVDGLGQRRNRSDPRA